MAEKLAIERYKFSHGKQHCDIFLDDLDVATVYEEKYVHLLAASPLMLEALEAAFAYVLHVGLYDENHRANNGIQFDGHEEKLAKQLKAAIAAAKGE